MDPRLPRTVDTEVAAKDTPSTLSARPADAGKARLRILVVDDDAPTRAILQRVLSTDFEADVCETDDGLGALERLHSEAFDLVLVDLNMQVIDGVETVQAIRRTPALRKLPVVAVSGAADERRLKQLVELNVTDVIAKPITPQTIRRRLAPLIARLLDTSRPTSVVRGRLNLRPSSRILLVGAPDRFQKHLGDHLSDVCDVATFPSAATALRDALERTPDAVFITGDDFLLPAALFARKLRPSLQTLPKVYLCEPSAAPFSDDNRWFDGRLNKVATGVELFKELRPLLTASGLAMALLPPASPLLDNVWAAAGSMIQQSLKADVVVQRDRPLWSSADRRTIEACMEVRVEELSWRVELLMTHDCALRYTSRVNGTDSADTVGEIDILNAVRSFVEDLATQLRDELLEYDVSAAVGSSQSRSLVGYGCFESTPHHCHVGWVANGKQRDLVAALRAVLVTE
jgi:CheY-like chemotaxis protein